jgi:hypothetical protein
LRSSNAAIAIVLTSVWLLESHVVSAHRRDEFLQAARIGIAADRIELELSLTPGISIADAIGAAVDRDRDGVRSDQEQRAFVNQALGAMQLAVDGRPLNITLIAATVPDAAALRCGDAPIEVRAVASLPRLGLGRHRLRFTNAYRRDISVYLVNALVPASDRITVGAQDRDPEQRETTIEYTIAAASSALLPLWVFAPLAGAWLVTRRRLLSSGTQRS